MSSPQRFRELSPERIPLDMSGKLPSTIYIERAIICGMPELKENPFAERIVRVFSSDPEKVNELYFWVFFLGSFRNF